MKKYMTASDAGRAVTPVLSASAIVAAANAGRLPVAAVTEGGIRLFDPDDVARFDAQRQIQRGAVETA